MKRRALLFAPLALFALLVAVLLWRLASPADPTVRSRLIGRPLPEFRLPPALPAKPGLSSSDLDGQPRLINLFASWCVPCIDEMRQLRRLRASGVAIDGIAIRDRPRDVAAFLVRNGDPYGRIGGDPRSGVQLLLGSSGVPESFIVDRAGIIRFHHVGPITVADLPLVLSAWSKAQ